MTIVTYYLGSAGVGVRCLRSFAVSLGKAVTIAVTPTLINTNAGAKRRFPPVRRQCYFEEEIQLLHFPPDEGYRYEQCCSTVTG